MKLFDYHGEQLNHSSSIITIGGKHWDSLALLQGSFGRSGPKVGKESENEFPGPLGPRAQKVANSRTRVKIDCFSTFRLFFDSVFDFLGPGAERPRNSFSDSFSNFGPRGRK